MKTQEHTAGPWKHYEQTDGMFAVRSEITNQRVSLGVQESDARLIAAAPQLLEALQLVDLHFQRNLASDNFQGDDEHEAWNAARNAIKYAKGETL